MAVRNLAIWTSTGYTESVSSRISVKQETYESGGLYFSKGREKSRFRVVDCEL